MSRKNSGSKAAEEAEAMSSKQTVQTQSAPRLFLQAERQEDKSKKKAISCAPGFHPWSLGSLYSNKPLDVPAATVVGAMFMYEQYHRIKNTYVYIYINIHINIYL